MLFVGVSLLCLVSSFLRVVYSVLFVVGCVVFVGWRCLCRVCCVFHAVCCLFGVHYVCVVRLFSVYGLLRDYFLDISDWSVFVVCSLLIVVRCSLLVAGCLFLLIVV